MVTILVQFVGMLTFTNKQLKQNTAQDDGIICFLSYLVMNQSIDQNIFKLITFHPK